MFLRFYIFASVHLLGRYLGASQPIRTRVKLCNHTPRESRLLKSRVVIAFATPTKNAKNTLLLTNPRPLIAFRIATPQVCLHLFTPWATCSWLWSVSRKWAHCIWPDLHVNADMYGMTPARDTQDNRLSIWLIFLPGSSHHPSASYGSAAATWSWLIQVFVRTPGRSDYPWSAHYFTATIGFEHLQSTCFTTATTCIKRIQPEFDSFTKAGSLDSRAAKRSSNAG